MLLVYNGNLLQPDFTHFAILVHQHITTCYV